jgi:hypothetical protein
MSQARTSRDRSPSRLPAPKNGWNRGARQPPTSRRDTSDIPVSSARFDEVFSQPPERDELRPRYPKIAARNVLDQASRHLHASHCHGADRQWPRSCGTTLSALSMSVPIDQAPARWRVSCFLRAAPPSGCCRLLVTWLVNRPVVPSGSAKKQWQRVTGSALVCVSAHVGERLDDAERRQLDPATSRCGSASAPT